MHRRRRRMGTAHGRCRSRGRAERAHRSLENRTERGFPQRPHASSFNALYTRNSGHSQQLQPHRDFELRVDFRKRSQCDAQMMQASSIESSRKTPLKCSKERTRPRAGLARSAHTVRGPESPPTVHRRASTDPSPRAMPRAACDRFHPTSPPRSFLQHVGQAKVAGTATTACNSLNRLVCGEDGARMMRASTNENKNLEPRT